tara:strand:+ start:1377 stop:2081 length:705 start_codon:yes stop_codon:yes gene_type:complete
MLKTKKIKWRRLLNELEYLYEEWDLLEDISSGAGGEFEAYYREFCARNEIDIDKLNNDNKERLSNLYGIPPEEVDETPVAEYSGSASMIKIDTPEEEPAVEETVEERGIFKKLHEDFHKVFKKLALQLHPDRIENYIADDEYKRKLAFDFTLAKSALDKKDYFKLIQLAKKYNIYIPENYTLQIRWFRKERDSLRDSIEQIKTTYNYKFAECETEGQRDDLVKKFIWHLFRVQA